MLETCQNVVNLLSTWLRYGFAGRYLRRYTPMEGEVHLDVPPNIRLYFHSASTAILGKRYRGARPPGISRKMAGDLGDRGGST